MADDRLLLATLPLVAATLARQRHVEQLSEQERWWLDFQAVAPPALVQYVASIHDLDAHPLLEHALEGLELAIDQQSPSLLRYTQGYTLKMACWRLGWCYAYERAAGVTAAVCDLDVQHEAADALLRWTGRDAHAAWGQPEAYLDRWRQAGTDDPSILARAGLHGAELELLAAEDELEEMD